MLVFFKNVYCSKYPIWGVLYSSFFLSKISCLKDMHYQKCFICWYHILSIYLNIASSDVLFYLSYCKCLIQMVLLEITTSGVLLISLLVSNLICLILSSNLQIKTYYSIFSSRKLARDHFRFGWTTVPKVE